MMTPPDIDDEPAPTLGRPTPSSGVLFAERVVVGLAITRRDLAEVAAETVKAEHFHQNHCRAAYQAALRLTDAGHWVDVPAVTRELERDGGIRAFGGDIGRVVELAQHGVGGHEAVRYHAVEVIEDYTRRQLVQGALRILQATAAEDFDAQRGMDFAMEQIQHAALGTPERDLGWVADDYDEWADQAGTRAKASIRLPWRDLNEVVTLRGGQLIVVGARPGSGKSLLGIGVAEHVAVVEEQPAAIFSLEMGRWEIYERMAAYRAKVLLSHFTNPEKDGLTREERARVDATRPIVKAAPLLVDASESITPQRIRARLRWMAGQGKPAKVAVIDYTQLMEAGTRFENRQLEVAHLSRQMKLIAKQFDIPVIALSQLNRGPEQRSDGRPKASDLRESGGLEQDADIVLLLHREKDEDGNYTGAGASQLEVNIAKNRGGSAGVVRQLAWRAHYGNLSNLAQEQG